METEHLITPHPGMIIPFGLLLGMIAVGPLWFANWWGKHYPKVALLLGGITASYYAFGLKALPTLGHTAHEYVSFMALVGSLFVVSGGIHIQVKGEATPLANTVFLLVGAVLANVLGTTGASMLLIRPWLRMNKYRVTEHHVVFFIFIVANVGGCLTPIGDPPLFAGFLKGVPFWWVAEHCWPMWATAVAILLGMFYVVDRRNFLRAPKPVRETQTHEERWKFTGLGNLFFLALILGGVFLPSPWRELLMIAAAAGSYFTTKKEVHAANDFNFHPIQEVAFLFIGIFATMMPALDWLQANAGVIAKNPTPTFFYWGTGILSSALDNMPTYLCFLKAICGAFIDQDIVTQVQALIQSGGANLAAVSGVHAEEIKNTFAALQQYHGDHVRAKNVTTEEIEICYLLGNVAFNKYLVAISTGAVFFGANTYIGNGPNFMVKAIAEHAKVRTPGFMGYIGRFALPFMVPMLVMVWWIFFR